MTVFETSMDGGECATYSVDDNGCFNYVIERKLRSGNKSLGGHYHAN